MKYSLVLGSLAATALAAQQEPVQVQEQMPVQPGGPGAAAGRPQRFMNIESKELNPETGAAANKKVEHEDFEPYPTPEEFTEAVLFEQFVGEPKDLFAKWRTSSAQKAGSDGEFSYVGRWAIEEPTVVTGFKGDKGLVLKTPAAHHAISRKFDNPLDVKGRPLVLQYEVKTQKGLQCGGAYVKLLSASADLDKEEFSNETPYQVMFGPDKCGSTDKVHLILRRKSPKTGEYEEKHLTAPPRVRPGFISSLYTLALYPDETFEIRVNGLVVKAGSLLDEDAFYPPINPPKEIPDVEDTKPEDWVDEDEIPDPDQAVKPDDWDEDAPMRIPDPEATQPDDWRVDLELYIPDPDATKPEVWDDEEDGEWIAPMVANPECEDVSGCGPWSAPLIRNPEYKGKWIQPLIANPEYKGEWEPRNVPNPDYYEDAHPSDLEPIGSIGLELWSMQEDILFDNFYVGYSIVEAEGVGNATWSPKYYVESLEHAANAPGSKDATRKATAGVKESLEELFDHPVEFLGDLYNNFISEFRYDPLGALKNQPFAGSAFALVFVIISSILFGLLNVILTLATGKELPKIEDDKKNQRAAATTEKVDAAAVAGSSSATDAPDVKKRTT